MVLEIFNNEFGNSISKYKLEYKFEYKLGGFKNSEIWMKFSTPRFSPS